MIIISLLFIHTICLIKYNCSLVSQLQNYNKMRIIRCTFSYQLDSLSQEKIDTRHNCKLNLKLYDVTRFS